MKIVSWHPVLTDHMSYTLEALQHAGHTDLVVNVVWDEHVDRQVQGWVKRHVIAAPICRIPSRGWFLHVIKQLRFDRNAVHLFGSPFEQPRISLTLMLAVAMGLKVYLISEPYSPVTAGYQDDRRKMIDGIKAKLRPLLYRIYGALLRRRLTGIFAISPLAVTQYRKVGIPNNRIFPFGYFVPRIETSSMLTPVDRQKGLRLIFIGTLIARKGLDILIDAIRRLHANGAEISLDVYGPGDTTLFDFDPLVIRYCGNIPFGEAQHTIRSYDLLALPSRYDGWGVVVNEALLAGVPVICSDRVGASAVIKKWNCGRIFNSEDRDDLYKHLIQLIRMPEDLLAIREMVPIAAAALVPEVAGRYMHEVIIRNAIGDELSMSSCPWYEI